VFLRESKWRQVRLREIAIVAGLFLGAPWHRYAPRFDPMSGLLGNAPPVLEYLCLAGYLVFEGCAHRLEGAHVLYFDLGAELPLPLGSHRHVGVNPPRTFLHIARRGTDPAQDMAQLHRV